MDLKIHLFLVTVYVQLITLDTACLFIFFRLKQVLNHVCLTTYKSEQKALQGCFDKIKFMFSY